MRRLLANNAPRRPGRQGRPGRQRRRRLLSDIVLAVAILVLGSLVAARFGEREPTVLSGAVVVRDGDSLEMDGERLRLRGIDAPEYRQVCERGGKPYDCGRQAREALERLASAGRVECRGTEHDRYGRRLVTCKAGGLELNRELVADGWAIANGDYEMEEASARQEGRGLWSGSFERPRDWRASHGAVDEQERDIVDLVLDWIRAMLGLS